MVNTSSPPTNTSFRYSHVPVRTVEFVADQAYPFLHQVRLAGEVEEPGLVQAGLVAVVVGAVDAGEGVGRLASAEDALARLGEDPVQTLVEELFAQLSQAAQASRIAPLSPSRVPTLTRICPSPP